MPSSNHVVYVSPTAIHGGAEEILLNMMRYARELGYEPVLVTPGQGWLVDQAVADEITVEIVHGIPDTMVNESWSTQFRPWLPNAYAIAGIVRKWNAVLVHSNQPRVSYHGGLGARLARVPAITHVHDIVNLPYGSGARTRLLSGLADRMLVVSHAVENAVVASAPQLRPRIQVLYNGFDASVYEAVRPTDLASEFGITPGVPVIGCASALTPWKGQKVLIDAFQMLRDNFPAARLIIVGGTQGGKAQSAYEVELRQHVAALGLIEAVTFTGWREDVWSLIKSFDIFAHVPTRPDPLPTALLHACGLRKAIVGTRIGGVPEILASGEAGLLIPPNNAEALADACAGLIRDPGQREALGASAHHHFERTFSRQQMIAGLAEAYDACLSRSGAAAL